MKKSFIAAALAVAGLPAFAVDYYVVVPTPGKLTARSTTPVEPPAVPSIELSPFTLPTAYIGQPYSPFNFNTLAQVKGDPTFNGTGVDWSTSAGTQPLGMNFSVDGLLSGTPVHSGPQTFTATATYRGAHQSKDYTLSAEYLATSGVSTAGLVAYFPLVADLAGTGPALNLNTAAVPIFAADSAYGAKPSAWKLTGAIGLRSDSAAVTGAGAFSAGAWIKTTTPTAVLIQQRDTEISGEFVFLIEPSGALQYWDYSVVLGIRAMAGTKVVTDGQWHLVGVTRDPQNKITLYVDGVLDYQGTSGPAVNLQATNGLAIGYDQRDVGSFFNGLMQGAMVFNRELAQTEWLRLFQTKAPMLN